MPSIRDFSGGVLNQELQNRDNGNGVLFDCKNVLSSWNGELRKRTGTRLLKELQGNSKIIPYRLPNGDDMIMLLKDKVINCYKFNENNELVPYVVTTGGGASVSFPTTGWSSNTNGDWTVAGTSTYTANNNAAYKAVQSGTSYAYNRTDFNNQGSVFFYFHNNSNVVFSRCYFTWTNTDMADANYVFRCGVDPIIQYSDDGTNWSPITTSVDTPTIESWTTTSSGMIPIKYSHTKYSYGVSNNSYVGAHKYWRVVFTRNYVDGEYISDSGLGVIPYLEITNITFSGVTSETNLVFYNCPYDNEDFDNIKWSQNYRTLTMACKGKSPYQIQISGGTFSDSLFSPSDLTTLWSTLGFPACVTYYQNRLWFGGFDAFPTRVYGSEFNTDYANNTGFSKFSIPSPVVSTSPIQVDGTEISNTIENMWGGNNALYCMSADGISMIDAQNAIVATNQVEFKLRNREPVNSMTPTVKDDIMIYLGRDKRKILITDYDFVVQRFKANCISDNYNDFFQSGIKELHYIPRKSSLIYGVLEDGKWFALLFDIDKHKNALFPFETSGRVVDIQPIKHGNETKLIVLTRLPSYQYILEEKITQPDQKIMDFMSNTQKEEYTENLLKSEECYLDHSIKLSFAQPSNIISPIPYSINTKLEVIADGKYLGEKIVTTNPQTEALYAWFCEPSSIIYTKTQTPTPDSQLHNTTSSPLYNSAGELLEDYKITIVSGNTITVQYPEHTYLYCYKARPGIAISPAYGISFDTDTLLYRYEAGDGVITFGATTQYMYAWKKDNIIVYTYTTTPRIFDNYVVEGQAASSSAFVYYSTAFQPQYCFTKTQDIDVGTPVYTATGYLKGEVVQILPNGLVCDDDGFGTEYYMYPEGDHDNTRLESKLYERNATYDLNSLSNVIVLDEPVSEVILGYKYDSYSVLKFLTPYTERKFPKEIAVNFINTGYLEVGNTFDSLKSVLNNLVESVNISNKGILMNGNYAKTLDKHSFETPYVIVRSDKGLPFIITGMDYRVDLSNYQGGV